MCVCVCLEPPRYIYIYIYIHICVCIYECMYIHTYITICIYARTAPHHIYVQVASARAFIYTHTYRHTRIQACIRIYVRRRMHAPQTYIDICKQALHYIRSCVYTCIAQMQAHKLTYVTYTHTYQHICIFRWLHRRTHTHIYIYIYI